MFNFDWKIGILALILMVGVLFETIKNNSSPSLQRAMNQSAGSILSAFTAPYSAGPVEPKLAITQSAKFSQPIKATKFNPDLAKNLQKFVEANQEHTTEFNPKAKGGEGMNQKKRKKKSLAKKTEDDEYEYFTDPVTGKKYRRKKKTVAKMEDSQTPETNPSDNDEAQEPSPSFGASGTVQTQVAAAGINGAEDNTVDDWIRLLLNQPDLELTRKFIKDYQSGKVTPAIYNQVTALMLEDPREEMKKLGVMCANVTPSMTSFVALIGLQKSERPGSRLYQMSDSAINQYTTLANLSILQKVMSGTDTYGLVVATQKMELAANKYLLGQKSSEPPVTPSETNRTVNSANSSRFQPFLPLLESLTKSSDGTVASQARSTLSNLQRLLGKGGPTIDTILPPPETTAGLDSTPLLP